MIKWTILIGLALQPLGAWGAPQVVTAGENKIYIDDTPAWVKPVALSSAPTGGPATDALTFELVDKQVSVRPGQLSRFVRLITRVNNQAGVETISRFPIFYIPNYQNLTIHGVWVTHDDKREVRLDPSAIRLIANELAVDQGIYRGIVTAIVFVKGLTAGDLLEISYSVSGSNPVLGEHALVNFPMAYEAPARVVHARLLAPTDRHFELKTFNTAVLPEVRFEDGYTDTTLLARDVPKYEAEPHTPPESSGVPFAEFSDFRSWVEVGDWGRGLFAWKGSLPAQLQARIQEWQAQSPRPEDRARLALDYVQKEIRYVSVSIGENALRPASPDEVIRRGFGDCKDKSLLLVTLLRSMGIAAAPALVSTSWEGAAFGLVPSAEVFDHVIVAAEIDGRNYWLDGTSTFQAGRLSERFVGSYGKALVIRADASTVETIAPPPDYASTYATSHRFVITKASEPVDLFIHATYGGAVADAVRARVQADRSAMEKEGLDRYRRLYPSAERVGTLTTQTDDKSGQLDAIVQYRIPEFFENRSGVARGTVNATAIWWELGSLATRKSALRLRYPLVVTQDIVVEFPEAVPPSSAKPVSMKDDYVTFTCTKEYKDKNLTLHFEYRTLALSVPAAAIERHMDLRKRISKFLAVEFSVPSAQRIAPRNAAEKRAELRNSDLVTVQQAAAQGNAMAQAELGIRYREGLGVQKDEAQAVNWLLRAAEEGDSVGQNSIGVMYEQGRGGLAQSDSEAVKWYRMVAQSGDASGQNNLGRMYEQGRGGLFRSDSEAVRWYRMSAQQGNAIGQRHLAWMYVRGRGVAQSDSEAVRWLRMAAEQGDALGQSQLGYFYALGRGGLPRSDNEAVKWYRMAAEQGNALGQSNLGEMYQQARGGLSQSDNEAVNWYRKAAEQGLAAAQYNLGMMYTSGKGVPMDNDQAMIWFQKAAAQGHSSAKNILCQSATQFPERAQWCR